MAQPSPSARAPQNDDLRLSEVEIDESVELVRFEMPEDQIEPLLERGVLPGCRLCPVRVSPSGDPIIEVDGVLLALRRETAGCLCVRRPTPPRG
jgi:Fe2+ transport system protein FeoA